MRILVVWILISAFIWACKPVEYPGEEEVTGTFVPLEAPFAVDSTSNPQGLGVDFYYRQGRGGANYLHQLTVSDFAYDIVIYLVIAEDVNGSPVRVPYIELYGDFNHETNAASAYNYTAFDAAVSGREGFDQLTLYDAQTGLAHPDKGTINLNNIAKGETGRPLLSVLRVHFKQLVLGNEWLTVLNEAEPGQEPIWVVKTREGRYIKLMFTEFDSGASLSDPAYLSFTWDFI